MSNFTGRWHTPMTTDEDKLEEVLSDSKAAYGELDGDVPPVARDEDEVGTFTLEEVCDYYDDYRPENITIIKRDED